MWFYPKVVRISKGFDTCIFFKIILAEPSSATCLLVPILLEIIIAAMINSVFNREGNKLFDTI